MYFSKENSPFRVKRGKYGGVFLVRLVCQDFILIVVYTVGSKDAGATFCANNRIMFLSAFCLSINGTNWVNVENG